MYSEKNSVVGGVAAAGRAPAISTSVTTPTSPSVVRALARNFTIRSSRSLPEAVLRPPSHPNTLPLGARQPDDGRPVGRVRDLFVDERVLGELVSHGVADGAGA